MIAEHRKPQAVHIYMTPAQFKSVEASLKQLALDLNTIVTVSDIDTNDTLMIALEDNIEDV